MTESKFKNNLLLFAEVIVPDLKGKTSLQNALYVNFNRLLNQLEYQGASKIKLLVSVIEFLSFVYHFKAFHNLAYHKRKHFINQLFQIPLTKIVAGLTGLRSLVLISYYGLEEVLAQLKNQSNS